MSNPIKGFSLGLMAAIVLTAANAQAQTNVHPRASGPTVTESIIGDLSGETGSFVGSAPYYVNLIQASDGNLYGTTAYGGADGMGQAFQLSTDGYPEVLHSFDGGATDGANPYSGLVQGTDGNFYGTTRGAAPGAASVRFFKLTQAAITTWCGPSPARAWMGIPPMPL